MAFVNDLIYEASFVIASWFWAVSYLKSGKDVFVNFQYTLKWHGQLDFNDEIDNIC